MAALGMTYGALGMTPGELPANVSTAISHHVCTIASAFASPVGTLPREVAVSLRTVERAFTVSVGTIASELSISLSELARHTHTRGCVFRGHERRALTLFDPDA